MNFVVNPSFTKFVFTKIFMGVAFVTCAVASVLIIRSSKKPFQLAAGVKKKGLCDNGPAGLFQEIKAFERHLA